jgi:NAD(P)-dependent dehydrogenase (short-subunit alcohol dehydrogenase family)
MPANYPLHGKVALVTGAAKGIGYETARQMHERGASVAVLDLERADAESAADAIGERTLALDADVTDGRAMELAVGEVVERLGGLDVVVANAGIAPKPRPMSVIGNEEFERVIDVDLYGVWRTVRPALPQVIERQGHVVVVASVYAFLNGMMAAPYAMAKAGVEQLGRALRVELAPHGASAGVAYFGFIDTDMVRAAFADPVAQRVEAAFPAWLTKRLTPDVAGRPS